MAILETEEVSGEALILEELRTLRQLVSSGFSKTLPVESGSVRKQPLLSLCIRERSRPLVAKIVEELRTVEQSALGETVELAPKHYHVRFDPTKPLNKQELLNIAQRQ